MVWCAYGISNNQASQSEVTKYQLPDQQERPNQQDWLLQYWTDHQGINNFPPQVHLIERENKPMKSIFLVVSSPKVMPTIITSGHWMVPCIKMPFITELYKILSCMMNIMDQSAHFLSTLLLNMTSSTVWFLPPVLIGLSNYGTPTTINKL